MALTQLVTDTDAFMERKMRGRRIRWEFVLLLVIGGLGAPGIVYVAQSILQEVGETEMLQFHLIGFAAEPIIGIFLVWLVYAVTAHVVAARAFGGRGPLRRLLKNSAWALVPIGVGNLARTIAIYFAFQGESLQDDPGTGTAVEQFKSLQEATLDKPEVVVGTLVLVGTVLVSGYLLSIAIEHSKDVSEADARKAAAVPVGAFVLYLVWGLL